MLARPGRAWFRSEWLLAPKKRSESGVPSELVIPESVPGPSGPGYNRVLLRSEDNSDLKPWCR
jgi:hypothetical protein